MRRLPLYVPGNEPRAAIASIDPIDHPQQECTRCPRASLTRLGVGGTAVPLRPLPRAHTPHGTIAQRTVVAIGGPPNRTGGRTPWSSQLEAEVADIIIRTATNADVVFDHAVRCAGDPETLEQASVGCRPYLAKTAAIGAMRGPGACTVLLFGSIAQNAYLGWSAPFPKVRRANVQLDGVNVWCLPELTPLVWRNAVQARWAKEDVVYALTHAAHAPPLDAEVAVIETLQDAETAERQLHAARTARSYDDETFGAPGTPGWEMVSAALTAVENERTTYVWPAEALAPGDERAKVFARVLAEGRLVCHNGKYDITSTALQLPLSDPGPDGLEADTLVWRKAEDTQCSGGLASAAMTVGMGGHKNEMDAALEAARPRLRRLRRAAAIELVTEWDTTERLTPKGNVSRKKIPLATRPLDANERALMIRWAWHNPEATLSVQKVGTYLADALDMPEPPRRWLHAAMQAEDDEWRYLYGLVDADLTYRYNAADAVSTARVLLAQRSEQAPIPQAVTPRRKLWGSHLARAPWALGRVEQAGLLIDEGARRALEIEIAEEIKGALARIHEVAPGLNPGSGAQLGQLLYEGLGLKVRGRTASGAYATDKVTLKALALEHPVVNDILTYKELDKLQGTYVQGLLRFVRQDGRIRPNLNIAGTETGRLSCNDPNMQILPSRGKWAKKVKNLFIAPAGFVLREYDYKTLEVVVAAMLSGDPVLVEIFSRTPPGDPHKENAQSISSLIWGSPWEAPVIDGRLIVDAEELAKEQERRRYLTKRILFGALYGQAAASLAEQEGIALAEAERAHSAVMGRLKGFVEWVKSVELEAVRTGLTWTWWNGERARCRPLPDAGSQDHGHRGHALRAAMNTRIQGTGHEFCLASLVQLVVWIWEQGLLSQLVMPVHDALYFYAHEDEEAELDAKVVEIMTGHPTARGLRLYVDSKRGHRMGEMEKA